MHKHLPKLFIFIDQYNSEIFKNKNKNIGIIYRNYKEKRSEKELIKIAFALAESFTGLLISRVFIGVGVSACLMGPLTGYRIWFEDKYQQRANSWMLMVACTGFVFSTLPVQILLPIIGWRWIFGGIAFLIFIVIILTVFFIPSWKNDFKSNNKKNAGSLSDVSRVFGYYSHLLQY